jgi:endoglucanase
MKTTIPLLSMVLLFAACKKDAQQAPKITNAVAVVAALASVDFKGVNWADSRDNFADDKLVLSGTTATDNNATIQTKANTILTAFQNAGANTVRLPVNPATVLDSWWQAYKGSIDKASSKNMKVLLGYWEGSSSRDGLIDNTTNFWRMWDTIVANYSSNALIYFEVFNEPHGYSATDLKTLYNQFVTRYPAIPKSRFVLDGVGYASDVNTIGADTRFTDCMLSFHDYTWFETSKTTTADWERPVKSLAYPTRTIVTEFGTVMTDGTNYSGAPGSNVNNTYLQGMTNSLHDLGVGCVYWPGLRTGDTYSMFTLSGTTVSTNNSSGLTRLKYAWGTGTIAPPYASFTAGSYYKVVNRNSGKALEVNGQSTTNGAAIDQWDYWTGANQQWLFNALGSNYFSVINRNSAKGLDVTSQSVTAGAAIIQWDYTGGTNQQWQVIDIGFGYYKILNRNSGFSLDVNGQSTANGGTVIQWNWNSGANQQWQISL